jgi:isopentenyl phosphate kinase
MLEHELVPLVFGDVALDEQWGSTIVSTEALFVYLAHRLRPSHIILVGLVDGVCSGDPSKDPEARLIPRITVGSADEVAAALGGSHGLDVTGGMRTKVQLMVDLVRELPWLQVSLISGQEAGLVERALVDPGFSPGTLITA